MVIHEVEDEPKAKGKGKGKETIRNLARTGAIFEATQPTNTQSTQSQDGVNHALKAAEDFIDNRVGGAGCSKDGACSVDTALTDTATESEDEVCVMCGKAESDREDLDVDSWAQCDQCLHWVHLEACCHVSANFVPDNALFTCPRCSYSGVALVTGVEEE